MYNNGSMLTSFRKLPSLYENFMQNYIMHQLNAIAVLDINFDYAGK